MNLNMNKTTHLNNETNINKLLNKGYFSLNNQKLIYSLYLLMKTDFNKRLGRKFKIGLLEQIVITLFKLKYNLPDRILGDKGYSGLKDYDVEIPIKCNELIYKQDKLLSNF